MFKNRPVSYVVWWVIGALLLVARIVIPILLVVNLLSGKASNEVERRTIELLLADFGLLMALLLVNIPLRLFRRLSWIIMLCSPVLLFGVLLLSVVILAYEGTSTETLISAVCWVLMAVYLLLPDLFIAHDVIKEAKVGFSLPDPVREPTLSERIRSAKK